MNTLIDRPRRSDPLVLARIEKLSEPQFKDFQELLELYRNSPTKEERAEIREALEELLDPQGLTETVNPSADISQDDRTKLEAYQVQVGKAIRAQREAQDLTQEQLAKKAKIQQAHLSRLENGQHHATGRTMRRIAKAMGVRVDSLDPGFDHND